jgi:hypothetical protein
VSRYDGMTSEQIEREREYRRKAQAKYRQSAKGKAAAARYWQSDKGRETMDRSRKANGPKHRERDRLAYHARVAERPDQARAQQRVNYAVQMGWITKPEACESCGKTVRLHGHHHRGYAREVELDVTWLCPRCHKASHGKGVV